MSSHRSGRRPPRAPVWPVMRPVVAALALAGLVAGALLALRPAPQGVPVLVVRHDVATGQSLSDGDVWTVLVPPRARPADALEAGSSLPTAWEAAPIRAGTVLTESNVAGSPASRALSPGEAQVLLAVGADQAQGIAAGDLVDLWAPPPSCEENPCSASLLASEVRITSVVAPEASGWASSETVRVGVILRAADTDVVLGHAGSGSLSLVLRAPGATADHPSTGAPP
ncbi:hypothetical protein ACFQWG_01270 [Schaalia naturae]|uniref:SAF domain-containing protein n=1 Tax=Schaalia naturae TaxID=635203 RepID=A0ABW2SJ30_9ACTO